MCGNLDGDVDPRYLVTRLVDVFVVRRVMSFEGLERDRIQVCRVCRLGLGEDSSMSCVKIQVNVSARSCEGLDRVSI